MHVRKLVKSGYASLVIAVPKDWIDRNKLKPGDLLYITDSGDKLSITTEVKEKPAEKKEKVICIDGKDERIISREITAAYLDNYDTILIKGSELKKKLKQVKGFITDFIALELIDESSDRIVAKSFLNLYDVDLKVLVRRMDNIVRSMISDTSEVVKDNELIPMIKDRDREVNRLNFVISKILKVVYSNKDMLRSMKLSEIDVLRYWELNGHLEKIGDRTKNIAKALPELSPGQRKTFMALFARMDNIYKDAMKSFYSNSLALSDEVSTKRSDLMHDIGEYLYASKSAACSQVAVNAFNMAAHINDITRIVRYLSNGS